MRSKFHPKDNSKRGTAVVELAVTLPVIVLLVFAALEGANMLFLRQAVVQSAYEGAKTAAKTDGDVATADRLVREILDARRTTPSSISFDPANVENLPPGTPFTLTVAVPGDSKSITGVGPFNGLTIEASATMVKE